MNTTINQVLERHPQAHAFGNYAPGRWAWVLTGVAPLVPPVAFRGARGAFDVPDHLLARPADGAGR